MTGVHAQASPSPAEQRLPPIARVRFDLHATEPVRLPPYAGSAWRGLLGHSLRRTVCVTRQPTCEGCLLTGTCAYSVFFESPPPSPESASRYTAVPHPFVLDVETRPERDVATGEGLRLGMNLIGPAVDLLPYLIQSIQRAGERGIGRAGGGFALKTVDVEQGLGSGNWCCVYDAASGEYRRVVGESGSPGSAPDGPLRLDLLTPVRIKRHGHFVGPAELVAEDLLRNLTARLSSLAAFYRDTADSFDWRQLAAASQGVSLAASEVRWLDWTRFRRDSARPCRWAGWWAGSPLTGPASLNSGQPSGSASGRTSAKGPASVLESTG